MNITACFVEARPLTPPTELVLTFLGKQPVHIETDNTSQIK